MHPIESLLCPILGLLVLLLVQWWDETPEWLGFYSWSMRVQRAYRLDDEPFYRVVTYNHRHTDGERLAHLLRRTLPREITANPPPSCELWTSVRVPPRTDCSPFLNLVAHYAAASHFCQNGEARLAVLVSMRHRLTRRHRAGCFVRAAYHDCAWRETADTLRRNLTPCVTAVRESTQVYDSMRERTRLAHTHLVFNKWNIDCIERDDGRILRLYRGGARVGLHNLLRFHLPYSVRCVQHADDRNCWDLLVQPMFFSLAS